MATTATVQVNFDDAECSITRAGATGFALRDSDGNVVTLQLREILRCLAIAEHEQLVAALAPEFWTQAKRFK